MAEINYHGAEPSNRYIPTLYQQPLPVPKSYEGRIYRIEQTADSNGQFDGFVYAWVDVIDPRVPPDPDTDPRLGTGLQRTPGNPNSGVPIRIRCRILAEGYYAGQIRDANAWSPGTRCEIQEASGEWVVIKVLPEPRDFAFEDGPGALMKAGKAQISLGPIEEFFNASRYIANAGSAHLTLSAGQTGTEGTNSSAVVGSASNAQESALYVNEDGAALHGNDVAIVNSKNLDFTGPPGFTVVKQESRRSGVPSDHYAMTYNGSYEIEYTTAVLPTDRFINWLEQAIKDAIKEAAPGTGREDNYSLPAEPLNEDGTFAFASWRAEALGIAPHFRFSNGVSELRLWEGLDSLDAVKQGGSLQGRATWAPAQAFNWVIDRISIVATGAIGVRETVAPIGAEDQLTTVLLDRDRVIAQVSAFYQEFTDPTLISRWWGGSHLITDAEWFNLYYRWRPTLPSNPTIGTPMQVIAAPTSFSAALLSARSPTLSLLYQGDISSVTPINTPQGNAALILGRDTVLGQTTLFAAAIETTDPDANPEVSFTYPSLSSPSLLSFTLTKGIADKVVPNHTTRSVTINNALSAFHGQSITTQTGRRRQIGFADIASVEVIGIKLKYNARFGETPPSNWIHSFVVIAKLRPEIT